jgi:hypothetical protein
MKNSNGSALNRSGFVTGLAWTFIVLGGFSTLIAVLQNIMLTLIFPTEELVAAAHDSQGNQPMPALFRFMFENFRLFFMAFLALSVVTLIAAIGLLKRRNWARLAFVGIMGFGVVWNLGGVALPFLMSSALPEMAAPDPDFQDNFKMMWNVVMGFAVVIGLGFAGLLAWVTKRLASADVKREFIAIE